MERIIDYLDNMFEGLPKTRQIKELKEDLLSNMEDKYNELLRSGKSEHEAIGIVFSEFGNIEELIEEFNIQYVDQSEEIPVFTADQVDDYLMANKKASRLMGIGVVLSIFGAALLILMYQLIDDGYITGLSESASDLVALFPLFLLIAIASGLFIYAVIIIDKYKEIEYSYTLADHVRKSIENKTESYHRTFTLAMMISVTMCVLSPISLLITSVLNDYPINYGVIGLLVIIAAAIYILMYYGGIQLGYKKLLKIGAYANRTSKVISAVAAVVWPLAVVIFLISGIVFHLWRINWLVFVVTGILFGMFSEAYKIMQEKG